MRILHTSDWHLGRYLFRENLLEDQTHALAQLLDVARSERPDAVAIAGDVYDRAVPPKEAVSLLDETLDTLVRGLGIPVVLIAGNHDSPERLGFGQGLLRAQGLHIAGPLPEGIVPVPFEDAHGPLRIYPLPYADPPQMRSACGLTEVRSHQQVLETLLARVRADRPAGCRAVVLAHAFVGGGETSESEEDLAVGGSGMVDAAVFYGIDYVALGHLHRPQRAGSEAARYSGSLLKYSFSEATHEKGVTLVELGPPGILRTNHVPLRPRRNVRILEGAFDDLADREPIGAPEDYLLIRLQDEEPVMDAMNRLRKTYPNLLHLEWPNRVARGAAGVPRVDPRTASPAVLFRDFFQETTGTPWTDDQKGLFLDIIEDVARTRREA